MSFQCGRCNKAVPNGIKAVPVVMQTRPRTYYNNGHTSTGRETVREIKACGKCADIIYKAREEAAAKKAAKAAREAAKADAMTV